MDATTPKSEKQEIKFKGKYSYGTGRRKNAVARVRIYHEDKKNNNVFLVNQKDYKVYFPTTEMRRIAEDSLRVTDNKSKLAISATIKGGGKKGQVESLRHGIARALVTLDENYKGKLREAGFLTRDPRVKERKKPGLKKARRAPQWQKR